jgi:hypothetical protein
MPAEDGLGGQEGEPGRPREDAAGGGEEHAIGWLPAWTADLAFDDAELMAEGEDLSAELGVRVTADDQDLEQKADDSVGDEAEHDPRASGLRISDPDRCQQVTHALTDRHGAVRPCR